MEALTEPSTSLSFSKGGERRPKLLGKWKRNRLPTPMRPWISQNGGANRAEREACRSHREGEGRPKFGFSVSRGLLRQGDRRPKFLNVPKTPGGSASEITGKMEA